MKREAKPETEYEKLVAAAMERLQAVEEKQQQMQNALSSRNQLYHRNECSVWSNVMCRQRDPEGHENDSEHCP